MDPPAHQGSTGAISSAQVTLAGVEDPNCKEPLAAAVLSIDLGKRVDNLEEPIVFTLPLSNTSRDPSSSGYVLPCFERNENGELLNASGVVDARCLVCGYYRPEKASWWDSGCELKRFNAVGAVCACTHLAVFSALTPAHVKALMCSNLELIESMEQWKLFEDEQRRQLRPQRRLQDDCVPDQDTCVPEDEVKPMVYEFTITPQRLAMPGIILGYSLLIAFIGIVKSCIAENREDFWFKPPRPPEPNRSGAEKLSILFSSLSDALFRAPVFVELLPLVLGLLVLLLRSPALGAALGLLFLVLWPVVGPVLRLF